VQFQQQKAIMLGEQIVELRGKRTGRRVLSTDGGLKIEVSFEDSGEIFGHQANNVGTYWSGAKPDGSPYGEGHGAFVTQDGQMATWKGQGCGMFQPNGAISYRGALYYNTASAKLARLNSVAVAFEFEVAADGAVLTKGWEWR
jgi:hypothetical protein